MPQAIVVVLSFVLLILALKPIALINAYFFMRPLVQVYANEHLTLLSLPITWPFAAVIIISAFPLGFLRRNFRYIRDNTVSLYALVFLSILSLAFTIDLTTSIGQVIKFINALCLVLVVSNAIKTKDDILRIYRGIVYSSVLPMIYGFYQYFTKTGHEVLGVKTDRVISVFGYPNMYGIFLAIIIFCVLILYVDKSSSKRAKYLYGIILILAVISSLLAKNRGTWIAIVIGIIAALPFYKKYISIKWMIIAFSLIAIGASGFIIERFLELSEVKYAGDTFSQRVEIWKNILWYIKDNPILGYGPGTSASILKESFGIETAPHNDYLRLLLEVGYVGPIVYIVLLTKELISNYRSRKVDEAWHVGYFTMALIIYWMIISMTQNLYHNVIVFPLFLVCCHLARNYTRQEQIK